MATEAVLVRKILQKLKSGYGMGVWYKIHTGPFQERGVPDIVGCLRGRFIAFEVKTPDNKDGVTNYQRLQLDRISSADGKTAVVTSVREVTDFLRKNFYKIRPKNRLQMPTEGIESTVEGESDGSKPEEKEPAKKSKKRNRSRKKAATTDSNKTPD